MTEAELTPDTDLKRVRCPEGHVFAVPSYVWEKFHVHPCDRCLRAYDSSKLEDLGFAAYRVTLPHSEVCMHMRIAGQEASVIMLENGMAQIVLDGKKFSAPVTRGEAGVPYDG